MTNKNELELKALLEVTEAINANLNEDSLYKILFFNCLSLVRTKKIAFIVNEQGWQCKLSHGTTKLEGAQMEQITSSIQSKKACVLHSTSIFTYSLPVLHKDKTLAYLLLGDIEGINESNFSNELSFIQTLTNIVMVAIENKRFSRKQLKQEALNKELEIAKTVQSLLFPRCLPTNKRLHISASYLPHHQIGGDYYDYIPLNEHKAVCCIADVSGKGVPAAMIMSNFQACLRTIIRQTQDLDYIIHELNYQVINNANGEHFITFFIAIIDLDAHSLSYINAGHNAPILIHNHTIEWLTKGSLMLGAFDALPFVHTGTMAYTPQSTLLLYTDGVTESRNEEDDMFGDDRLLECIQDNVDNDNIHERILTTVNTFRGNCALPDDLTLVTVRLGE